MKTRLKLLSIILASIFFLGTVIPSVASGANGITTNNTVLVLSRYTAQPGDSVTASGTADANTWVSVKVLDSAQSIIVFDAVKSDANGSYRCTFILPGTSEGTLTVVAGYGSNVANKTITVSTTPVEDTTAPSWDNGNLEATDVGQSSLTLSWSDATDNVAVTGYKVYQGDILLTAGPVAGTSYNVTGLSAGTEYTFKVQAVDAAGNESTDGPSVTVTTTSSSSGGGSVTLTLSRYTAQPGDSVTASGTADANTWVSVKVLDSAQSIIVFDAVKSDANGSYRCTFILPGTSEGTLTVVAGYGSNVANQTLTVSTTPVEDATAPSWDNGNLEATDVSQSSLTLSWSGATDNVDVTGYKVYQGDTLLTAGPVAGTSYNVTGLSAGTEYTFKVQAVDAAGNESADGPSVTVTTESAPVEDTTAPSWGSGSSLTASDVGQSSLTLSWSDATDNVAVTGYKVYQGDILLTAGPVAGTSYNVTGLSAGTEYTFTVQAVDATGNESTDGPSVTVTTKSSGGGGGGGSGSGSGSSAPQAVSSTTGTAMVAPSAGGIIGLGSEAVVIIPANALQGTSKVEVKVQKADQVPETPAGFKLAGLVYEFSVDGREGYSFAKKVTIKISFDPDLIGDGETPVLQYYDQAQSQWINIGGTVSGTVVSAQVDHLTKFAVMAAVETEEEPPEVPAEVPKDIAGHWAYDNINELVSLGAITGYPDGNFRPDSSITRAEFATVLAKAFKLAPRSGKIFTDTVGHWARDYIATVAANGIVNGYDDTTFGPDDLITREQMAVMIVKAAKLTPAEEENRFADSGSISGWAREAVATATKNGIMSGYPDNTMQPLGNATRAEAVTVIVKALGFKSE